MSKIILNSVTLESLYGGQFTRSTKSIKPLLLCIKGSLKTVDLFVFLKKSSW